MTTKADLERRVQALERAEVKRNHTHIWRYNKHVTVYPPGALNPGRAYSWSWGCIDETCFEGNGLANYPAALPSHFPGDLR